LRPELKEIEMAAKKKAKPAKKTAKRKKK